MKVRHSTIIVAAIAVVALVLAGCAGTGGDKKGSGDKYRVLITGALSGQGALLANSQTSILAAKAGVETVNKAGGVGGRKVDLKVVDDGGNATTAVSKLREAIASGDKPDLFMNSGPSTITAATLPILKQNKILSFNMAPTADSANPTKFPLNFDLVSDPATNAMTIAHYVKSKGYQSVGLIHGSSAYGEVFSKDLGVALRESGVSSGGSEEYDIAALDMTAQLQSLKNKGTKALVIDAYGAPLGYLLTSLQRLNWNIPLIGNTSVSGTSLVSKPAPQGVLGSPVAANMVIHLLSSTVYDPADTAVNTMVANMKALGDIQSTLLLSNNYDGIHLVAAAAAKVGNSTDTEALAKALEDPAVLTGAKVAAVPAYHFTPDLHASRPGDAAYRFVSPTKLLDGQYGNPAA